MSGRSPDFRPSATARGYGPEWKETRAKVLRANPWCQAPGCRAPATEVHHLERKAHGGSDDRENLVGLCRLHHNQATGHERKRANTIRKRAEWERKYPGN